MFNYGPRDPRFLDTTTNEMILEVIADGREKKERAEREGQKQEQRSETNADVFAIATELMADGLGVEEAMEQAETFIAEQAEAYGIVEERDREAAERLMQSLLGDNM